MKLAHLQSLEEFGTRSLVVHGIMVVAFANAVLAGLFVAGELGLVSFVALLNFTAGLWVAHSIHSLGNVGPDAEYRGVINELLETDAGHDGGFDAGRFGRLLALVAAVTAIALLTSAQVLSGAIFSIAVVAVGAVAVVTAIVGFLIALGAAYDDAEAASIVDVVGTRESADSDGVPVGDR
ncbi:hypothetical protein [Natrarchaeobius oligotrophus]|uniref:Uncharacterized protein n=1 Tax=Natrarchaeobius chitinivorans TaxID=1679083 RepID=A0A3N6M5D4_NATCH|nr:hypothetical protein [Natrarchaeobius chitinivorans]RQG98793.1 hypothetical protein EA472_16370 [Natrarchaeobius chitinivorans]